MDEGFTCIWKYEVSVGREMEFETLYGPKGAWARFFEKSSQYLGTDLLRDRGKEPDCVGYLTIDRWQSEDAYRAFLREHPEEYAALDREGDRLTTSETCLGEFVPVASGS